MCIFTGEVEEVASTRIFAALVGPKQQMTIYSNEVNLADAVAPVARILPKNMFRQSASISPVAMILPIPLPKDPATGKKRSPDEIKMLDVSSVKDIFECLDAVFPKRQSESLDYDGDMSFGVKSANSLEVHRCGSYRYSVVPDIQSLGLLDRQVFNVNVDTVKPLLETTYKDQFAYLVCIIDESAAYSPIAYVHPSNGRLLFVPTLHEHGHGHGIAHTKVNKRKTTDDWDHEIFSVDSSAEFADGRPLEVATMLAASVPRFVGLPHYHKIDWKKLKKRSLQGFHPNADIVLRA